MTRLISFMHISLDGFVAGPNGEMNWIKVDEELFDHVGKRIGESNTAFYGRVTYEMMEGYWPTAGDAPDASRHDIDHSRWYKTVHKVVLSKSMKDASLPNTTIISDRIAEKVEKIGKQAKGDILIFGSPRATHSLIELDLIDGYWLFVNPILLGKGIPLFKGVKERTKLKLLSTRSFTNGVTELSYVTEK